MDREIKFRYHFTVPDENEISDETFVFSLQEIQNGDVEGTLSATYVLCCETKAICQFTGQTVKGKEVFADDILECDGRWYQVSWSDHHGGWIASGLFGNEDMMLSEVCGDRDTCLEGNLHDNPELLNAA